VTATRPPVRRSRIDYKWIALSVTTLGAAMAAIDASIVVLALPSILRSLHASLVTVTWVTMGYILTSCIALTVCGRLADMFGRVRMYNLGFLVFTVGSVLCALAFSGLWLILFRLVQGAGAAMLIANSMAILTEAFPANERGRAMGINSVTWALGGLLGPLFGGLILATTNWRWIFLVNLPIGALGTIWGYVALHELSHPSDREPLDVPGIALFGGGLFCLLYGLTQSVSWGLASPRLWLLFAAFLILQSLFYLRERSAPAPLLDLSLFRSRIFSLTIAATTLESLAVFAINFLVVFYLQGVKGVAPLHAALLILPLAAVQSLLSPVGGALSDRFGARFPASAGLIIEAAGCVVLAALAPASPYWLLFAGLVIFGSGAGIVWTAQTNAAMGTAPLRRLGITSATLATFRQCGMVTSYALALAVAAATVPKALAGSIFLGTSATFGGPQMAPFASGMHSALLVSMFIVVAAAALTVFAGDTGAQHQLRAGSALESARDPA
jgi:EmrB/QacA subfamily drug resistance transporter